MTALLLLVACGSEPTGPAGSGPPPGPAAVATLEPAGGAGQSVWSRRRSPEAFRVRAFDAGGHPVPDARVRFALEGVEGRLTQPEAVADSAGVAETWLLDARPGRGAVVAAAGGGVARLAVTVERAPGSVVFDGGTGAVGLPDLPHPDSLVSVTVLDTEGEPMAGQVVWFAGPRQVSRWRDTTDAGGRASTVVRRSASSGGGAAVWAFLDAFPEVAAVTERPVEPAARRVVLVSVDGLRADALERWRPPNLLGMAAEGARAARARTVVPSLTTPGHLSLLSGVGPGGHGVWGDELEYTEAMASLEPPFRVALRRGLVTDAFLSVEGPLGRLQDALACRLALGLDSLTLTGPTAAAVVDAAAGALADPEARLLFLHLPDPDLAGHAEGFTSPAYGEAVLAADRALGRVLAAVPDGTLVIVTSDHGGGGGWGDHLHGSGDAEDVEVPLLIRGPRAVATALEDASILDVAPTLLWALGLPVPASYEGRPLLEAFH